MSEYAPVLAELHSLLNSDEPLRIEFSESYGLTSGQTFVSARFFERRGTRWVKKGPVIVPPPDNATRAGLLETLAHLAKGDGIEAGADA